MTNQKCTKCGLVSWANTTTCKRCGGSLLEPTQTSIAPPDSSKSTKAADVISCTLLALGAGCVIFRDRLGPASYLVAMLAFLIGLSYSIVRVYRSTRRKARDRKRDAVIVLVINAVLVMLLGAAVPVYYLSMHAAAKRFDWRQHASITGRYTIQFPEEPEEIRQPVQTPTGPLTLNRMTANMGQRGTYTSAFYDLWNAKVTVSDDELLDRVLQDRMSEQTCVLLSKRPFVVNSANGVIIKALEAELQLDSKNTSLLRLYWVKERSMIYMNKATFRRSKENIESAEKFLNSFQLTEQ